MHRAAEVFSFSGGEELSAAIDEYSHTGKKQFFLGFTDDSGIRDKPGLIDDFICEGKHLSAKRILQHVLKVEPDNFNYKHHVVSACMRLTMYHCVPHLIRLNGTQ